MFKHWSRIRNGLGEIGTADTKEEEVLGSEYVTCRNQTGATNRRGQLPVGLSDRGRRWSEPSTEAPGCAVSLRRNPELMGTLSNLAPASTLTALTAMWNNQRVEWFGWSETAYDSTACPVRALLTGTYEGSALPYPCSCESGRSSRAGRLGVTVAVATQIVGSGDH